jgi:sulfur transfer complex TusBCD TusB component (DsrH family)
MTVRTIPDTATVVVAGELLHSAFGAETVILSLEDGVYYGLEEVGARIWELLQRPIQVSAIRDALVAEYDVDPERCRRDLLALLQDLAARGLVEVRERGDGAVV